MKVAAYSAAETRSGDVGHSAIELLMSATVASHANHVIAFPTLMHNGWSKNVNPSWRNITILPSH